MSKPLETISVQVEHCEWNLEDLQEKYVPCDFTYYYSLCNRSGDYSEWMFGQIIVKDGEMMLSFDDIDDMQDDIKVDSKLGREILAMSEM